MTPSEAVEEIVRLRKRIVDEVVVDLFAEFQRVSPVDTGNFRASWSLKKELDGWKIINGANYATILYDGRRLVAGKWYGSEQWQEGGAPILAKYNELLNKRFKEIKV